MQGWWFWLNVGLDNPHPTCLIMLGQAVDPAAASIHLGQGHDSSFFLLRVFFFLGISLNTKP